MLTSQRWEICEERSERGTSADLWPSCTPVCIQNIALLHVTLCRLSINGLLSSWWASLTAVLAGQISLLSCKYRTKGATLKS